MIHKSPHINCLMYSNGRCGHPSAKGLWGQKPCVLDMLDPRINQCAVQVAQARPSPSPMPPCKPPCNPDRPWLPMSPGNPHRAPSQSKAANPTEDVFALFEDLEREYWEKLAARAD
jgi:hypothetical protein